MLLAGDPGEVLLARFDLDGELSEVAHPELQLALMLDEDLQGVLDLEQAVVGRVSEDLHHVAQLGVQHVHIAEFLFGVRHHEFDSSCFSDLFRASIVLQSLKILLNREERLRPLSFAGKAVNHASQLDLE